MLFRNSPQQFKMNLKKYYLEKTECGTKDLLFSLKMLCVMGIKTPNCSNAMMLFLFKIYRYTVFFIGIFMISTCTADLYVVRGNWVLIGEDLCVMVGIGLTIFKYIMFMIKHDEIEQMINTIVSVSIRKGDLKNDRAAYMHLQEDYAILDISIKFFFHVLAVFFYIVFIFFAPPENSLPLRALFPFEINEPYMFYSMYFLQGVGIFYVLGSILTLDQLSGVVWHHIGLHFLILQKEFESLAEGCRNSARTNEDMKLETNKRLRLLIMRHQFAIDLARKMNSITSSMLAAQMFASNFMICLTGFEATLTLHDRNTFLKFVLYMNSALGQLGYWCIYGNNVRFLSTTIAEAAFSNCRIYPEKYFMKDLRMVIMRAQKPVDMKGGGLFPLCLPTFLTILRGSYSYFTLLRTLNESS